MSRDRGPTSPKACDRAAGVRHSGPYCWAEALHEDLSKGVTLAEWSVTRVTRQPVWDGTWPGRTTGERSWKGEQDTREGVREGKKGG